MARYRNEMDERDYDPREERLRRETLGSYDEPYNRRPRFDGRWEDENRSDYGRGRFGERANYQTDEPRYSSARERWNEGDRFRDQGRRSTLYDIRGDLSTGRDRERYSVERSRLRCRDVMTTDLAVATRDTRLTQIALMMKQEDTGVIPVVEYDVVGGNGKTTETAARDERDDRQYDNRTYSRGKLVGLITDRDLVIRAVSEGKDCNNTRAEDIMSVDIHTTRPNDRVVDVIRMMANKQVRRIPVVNDNRYLVGMISMADVAQEVDDDRELGATLEEISKTTTFWNRVFG